jgi:hypothetical protein
LLFSMRPLSDGRGLTRLCSCEARYFERADERTRTAFLISLRVIIHALQGFAQGCKSRIPKPLSFLCLAVCCTVLRSRWYQSGVNITILSAFDRGLPQAGSTAFLARQTTTPAPNPPQPLASPSGASPASCKGSGKRPETVLGRLVFPYWTVEIVRIVRLLGTATRSRCEDSPPGLDSLEVRRWPNAA